MIQSDPVAHLVSDNLGEVNIDRAIAKGVLTRILRHESIVPRVVLGQLKIRTASDYIAVIST
jgi:hypothetical protein